MDEDMDYESAAAVFAQAYQEQQAPQNGMNGAGERKMLYVPSLSPAAYAY